MPGQSDRGYVPFACTHVAVRLSDGGRVYYVVSLGLGEAGNFPASIKTVAEWFPKKERALATGIFNSGINIGAILAPLCGALIALNYGWYEAFIVTGAIGFIWLVFWLNIIPKA